MCVQIADGLVSDYMIDRQYMLLCSMVREKKILVLIWNTFMKFDNQAKFVYNVQFLCALVSNI